MQPAFLAEDDGGDGTDSGGFSSPNRASCVNGLETLLGGDPQKNGGDDATCVLLCSILEAPCKINKFKSDLERPTYFFLHYHSQQE